MSKKNNDYTTGNALDYWYYQNYYKLIEVDLSRQTNTNIHQKINFKKKNYRKIMEIKSFLSLKNRKSYCKLFFKFIEHNRLI